MINHVETNLNRYTRINGVYRSRFTSADIARVDGIYESLETFGPMDTMCRAVVVIPVKASDSLVINHTLLQFSRQEHPELFETIILINGNQNTKLLDSPAYMAAKNFQTSHPDFKLSIGTANYNNPQGRIFISEVRRDASEVMRRRAVAAGISANRILLLARDADLINIHPQHVSSIIRDFDLSDQSPQGPLSLLWGPIDYPTEAHSKDHLLYARDCLLRLLETLDQQDIIDYSRHRRGSYHDQNMTVRLSDFIGAGGYDPRNRIGESTTIAVALGQQGKRIDKSSRKRHRISTSARRMLSLNGDFKNAHTHFGMLEDEGIYTRENWVTHPSHLVSSAQFKSALERELTRLHAARLSLMPHLEQTVLESRMSRVLHIMGIQIQFDENSRLHINDISAFKEYVEAKFSV